MDSFEQKKYAYFIYYSSYDIQIFNQLELYISCCNMMLKDI